MNVKIPKGLELPEGTVDGDKVFLMAEFELKSGGKLCLESIEGYKLEGYKDDAKSESMPQENEFIGKYNSAMSEE